MFVRKLMTHIKTAASQPHLTFRYWSHCETSGPWRGSDVTLLCPPINSTSVSFHFVISCVFLSFSHSFRVAVSAFVPPSSLLNPVAAESHFIPPPVYLPSLSISPWLIVLFLVSSSSHPLCVFVLQIPLVPYCTSHVSLSPFFVYLTEHAETKGHAGLTLIDALDGEEEEEGEGGRWLRADKVNSVFPSSSSPGGN